MGVCFVIDAGLAPRDTIEQSVIAHHWRSAVNYPQRFGSTMDAEIFSPMDWLRAFGLSCDVVSCKDAAEAKGFPLQRELKSLILKVDTGLIVAHLSGSESLSLRQVKRHLKSEEARLATLDEIKPLGVEAGTISPFLPNLWKLPHLIDVDLLEFSWVSTNNGTLNGYIVFDPILLCRARTSYVGEFRRGV